MRRDGRKSGGGADSDEGVFGAFFEGVAVGAAGDVIADGAVEAEAVEAFAGFGAHVVRVEEVMVEEAGHEADGFVSGGGDVGMEVHFLEEESAVGFEHGAEFGGEVDEAVRGGHDVIGGLRIPIGEFCGGALEDILDLEGEEHADGGGGKAVLRAGGVLAADAGFGEIPEVEGAELLQGDQAGFEAVLGVMGLVGDVVGDIGNLGFGGLPGADGEAVEFGAGVAGDVFAEAGADFPGEVESVEFGVILLEEFDPAEALEVMVEAAVGGHAFIEGAFAAVAEGAVADIVGEGDGGGEVLVDAEGAGEGAGHGGHFDGVGEAGPVVILGAVNEDLGFVFEAAEAFAVDDAVAVPLKIGASGMAGFVVGATAGGGAAAGEGGEEGILGGFAMGAGFDHDCFIINSGKEARIPCSQLRAVNSFESKRFRQIFILFHVNKKIASFCAFLYFVSMRTKTSPTIADVARHAGVSTATVSRLINGVGPVSEYTEKRVREAIEVLKYTPKRKRRLRHAVTGLPLSGSGPYPPLAFVRTGTFPSQDRSPVTEHLVEALHRGAHALGRTLTVHTIPDLGSVKIRDVIGEAQGVLLRSSNLKDVTRDAVAWLDGIPAVQVLGENQASRLWLDHVTPDNAQAGALAADYLLGMKLKKLVFAAPTMICGVGLERCVSFVRNACEAGREVSVLLQTTPGGSRQFEQELAGFPVKCTVLDSRQALIREIASTGPKPFGLFVPTDLELAMMMPQLQMMDLKFGKEVFAIGCDHETRCMTGLDPLPATMNLHLENIAARAIRRLIFRIEHPNEPLVRIGVAPKLVLPGDVMDAALDDVFPRPYAHEMSSADIEV